MLSLTSFSLLSSSFSSIEFKFPANPLLLSPPKLLFRPKQSLKLQASSFPATPHHDYGDYEDGDWTLKRREMVVSIATLSVVFCMQDIVKAEELDASAYMLVKEQVRKVVFKGKAAGVLRLVFHDAGTFEVDANSGGDSVEFQNAIAASKYPEMVYFRDWTWFPLINLSGGMNGSVIYELERPENAGLKKSLKILQKAKNEVDAVQPVSWADMIAVAGAEAVSICGGPAIPVQMGRLDSIEPDVEGKLPQETLDVSGLKQSFERKGFSTQELVALSGAHTLGGKGFGNPNVFDNSYYKILLEKPWKSSGGMSSMIGLPSDHALVEDDECLRWIKKYADNQASFFGDFKSAYVKLVNSGARWKSE